jgi:hypothetical protein
MNNVDSLLDKICNGSDYDVAKLFIAVFPDCQKFTNKEISIKLSEDIYDMIIAKVKLLTQKKMTLEHKTCSGYCEYEHLVMQIDYYQKKLTALRTHKQKQLFIAEIKAIR